MSSNKRSRHSSGPEGNKKKKYACKFCPDWVKAFDFIRPSGLGQDMAYCNLCSLNFSVASGGLYDVKRHSSSGQHTKAEQCKKQSMSMSSFVSSSQSLMEKNVIRAETLFAFMIAEHNVPFALADHFSEIVKKMFPDSQIAGKFSCKRTKCTQIVKQA